MYNKDFFIKKVANDLNIDEIIVNKVISTSYKDVIRVLSATNISEIEISGLGKFKLNKSRIHKELDKLYDKRRYIENILNSHKSGINLLSSKDQIRYNKTLYTIQRDISNIENKYKNINY